MIYNKNKIDMSLVNCPFEEQGRYIYIEDEYTNILLKLSGYTEINIYDFQFLCMRGIFINKLEPYSLKSREYRYWYEHALYVGKGRIFRLG